MKQKHNKNKKDKLGVKTQSKKQIEQIVRNLVENVISSLGYELWNIEYYNDGIEWLLEITIDNLSGVPVSIDDCEKVTHAVNPIIDEADPIENSYSLAVSSPGLNRELKNASHFGKYMDKEVSVKLFAKNETVGGKIFNAVLKEISDKDNADNQNYKFELIPDKNMIIFTKKEIAHIYARDFYDEI